MSRELVKKYGICCFYNGGDDDDFYYDDNETIGEEW